METIAQLDENFARVQVVRSAKSKTIVEEDAAVGDVDALQVEGESFTETLAKGKVEGGVRLEVIAGDILIAVGESRGVVHVG